MIIYFAAFILTIIFIRKSAYYYNLLNSAKGKQSDIETDSLSSLKPCVMSVENELTKSQMIATYIKYIVFFLLSVFPLFFIAAVRYDVGTDYFYTYVPNFYKILCGEKPYSEIGFNYFNKLIQLFTRNSQWLFVITGFIFSFFLIRTIIKYSPNATVSVISVFCSCLYFWSLNNVRQAIAVVLILAAFPHLIKKHFIRYFIYVCFAFIFHLSSLIMIIPYFLVNIKILRDKILYFTLIAIVLLPFLCGELEQIASYTKYSYYFTSNYFNTGDAVTSEIIINSVLLVIAFLCLYKRRNYSKFAYVLLFMQILTFFSIASSLFLGIPELCTRLMMFFQIYQVLLIPYCFEKAILKDENKKLFILIYTSVLGCYVTNNIMRGSHEVIPYKTIFFR